jgi:hypothetical protein
MKAAQKFPEDGRLTFDGLSISILIVPFRFNKSLPMGSPALVCNCVYVESPSPGSVLELTILGLPGVSDNALVDREQFEPSNPPQYKPESVPPSFYVRSLKVPCEVGGVWDSENGHLTVLVRVFPNLEDSLSLLSEMVKITSA